MSAPDWSRTPVVLAPMAGGPSTVDLAVAVAEAGGFAPRGGLSHPERLRADIGHLRSRTSKAFGVNVFAPSPDEPAMLAAAESYAALLAPWAAAAGVRPRGSALRRRRLRREGGPARRAWRLRS